LHASTSTAFTLFELHCKYNRQSYDWANSEFCRGLVQHSWIAQLQVLQNQKIQLFQCFDETRYFALVVALATAVSNSPCALCQQAAFWSPAQQEKPFCL